MKTVKEWLETIEDNEVRERALRNADVDNLNEKVENAAKALQSAFAWYDSLEGFGYWDNVHAKLLNKHTPEPVIPYSELDGE